MEEATLQNVINMGTAVTGNKRIVVQKPPPNCLASSHGVTANRENSVTLLKLSVPAASAGRGAFLIEGYCSRLAPVHARTDEDHVPMWCGRHNFLQEALEWVQLEFQ